MPGADALAVEVRAGGSLRCSWAGAVLLGWSEKGKEAGLGWGEEGRRERFGPPGWVWALREVRERGAVMGFFPSLFYLLCFFSIF